MQNVYKTIKPTFKASGLANHTQAPARIGIHTSVICAAMWLSGK